MVQITEAILRQIAPFAPKSAYVFVPYLNETMKHYSIDTVQRQAMFLAQVAHESGSFRYVRELASGKAYEGRKDLGNVIQGDGVKYKGRGLIQCTGRANYRLLSTALGADFIAHPELLESAQYAVKSAGWFWDKHKLNEVADHPEDWTIEHNDKIYSKVGWATRIINGGQNGLEDRKAFYGKTIDVLTPLSF